MNVDNPVFLPDGQLETCDHCPLNDLPLAACFRFGGLHTCPTKDTFNQAVELAKEYVNDI